MKILAADTSGKSAAVAILEEDSIVGEILLNTEMHHSENLLPALDRLCQMTGMSVSQVDLFVCTTGPGSFTGLRIGLGTMKGLALATGKPLIGISTLEALAGNASFSPLNICPMLDARKNQIYTALYKKEVSGGMQCLIPDRLSDIGLFLREISGETLFLGDGAVRYRKEIKAAMMDRSFFGEPYQDHVRGSVAGLLGYHRFKGGISTDASTLTPCYLRLSEAEEKWRLKTVP
jgi:tRNA threonylcarbamoyladenosine biosynthesis protein TsaB